MKEEKKHKWIMVGDDIDIFAAEDMPSDFHNGPKCQTCGFEFCHHCDPDGYNTECGTPSIAADATKTAAGEAMF